MFLCYVLNEWYIVICILVLPYMYVITALYTVHIVPIVPHTSILCVVYIKHGIDLPSPQCAPTHPLYRDVSSDPHTDRGLYSTHTGVTHGSRTGERVHSKDTNAADRYTIKMLLFFW